MEGKDMLTERFYEIGIVPVIVMEDPEDAEKLADVLCKGGLPCAEVTFRTAAAAEVIRRMKKARPDMLVGAGTVLKPSQVDSAAEAGAEFIVSPGINPATVEYCIGNNIPIIPGTQTPSEMELALSFGLETVKFFPAEPAGGLTMIKAVAAPFTSLRFMPTGGINAQNVSAYLEYERILACGGSWMVSGDLLRTGNFDEILRRTEEAASIVRRYRKAD
ncbi:MAG: bifunctional 4-hydroxy-2-oxoglutarate aldolase/2-dehydro-3-deoxy-phosphogluconate aldolase [Oscillospiraceae bacterium]|nr:bifunctional 4-hydroxy-2-oxoglutarate aldolase/2-dehydro-3-deoxy-phosphogluconate aldolase [Oscillospiraceae bacterium]